MEDTHGDVHKSAFKPQRARVALVGLIIIGIGTLIIQPSSTPIVKAQTTTVSTYNTNSPHWSHINIADFGTNLRALQPGAIQQAGYEWYASHVDSLTVGMNTFSYPDSTSTQAATMKSLNPTINTVGSDIDLFMCEHFGCWKTNATNTNQNNLPEEYYLHFSQNTHIDFFNHDHVTPVGSVDIPGCPDTGPVTAACRVQLFEYGEDTAWLPNTKSTAWRTWYADNLLSNMAVTGSVSNPIDTVFFDGHGMSGFSGAMYVGSALENRITTGGGIREYGGKAPRDFSVDPYHGDTLAQADALDTEWSSDVTSWLAYLRSRLAAVGKNIRINTGTTIYEPLIFQEVLAANGVLPEYFNSAYGFAFGATQYTPFLHSVRQVTAAGGTVDLYFRPCADKPADLATFFYTSPGNYDTAVNRFRMWNLAGYYMAKESTNESGKVYFDPTFCFDYTSTTPAQDLEAQWLKAYEHDVGQPVGEPSVIQEGKVTCPSNGHTDPSDAYHIYSRQYSKALILLRTRDALYCETYGDPTIVNVPLSSSMVMLEADGTYSAPMTSVPIRNGEAVIMVPAPDTTAPGAIHDLQTK